MMKNACHVARLRVHKLREDSPAVRLRLANVLNTADLHPAELPPSSVLIVRRIVDPLPGQLAGPTARWRPNSAWESAVRQSLGALGRRAARPVNGLVVGNPEAVLFADEAEMLACLALDISRGEASRRWWWRATQVSLPATDTLLALLCQKAIHLPAALQSLLAWGQAAPVLRLLSPAQALAVLAAVGRAHNLPDWSLSDTGRSAPAAAGALSAPASGEAVSPGGRSVSVSPWQIPLSTAVRLGREQLCLLGISLTLRERPVVVRRPAFGQALRQWWGEAAHAAQPGSPAAANEPVAPPVAGAAQTERRAVEAETAVPSAKPAHNSQAQLNGPLQPSANGTDEVQVITTPDLVTPEEGTADELPPTTHASHRPESVWPEGVVTQLAGVLYLINLIQYLDLPACFEADWQLASQVGPWGVLELLGRALLPDDRAWDDDPLWDALAMLDGRRPGTLPGDAFQGSGGLHLPAQWIGDREPPWPWAAGAFPESAWLERLNPKLRGWLRLVLPFVRWRLGQALGCDGTESALSRTMLVGPARLFITASHVDLVLRLEDISLPVRLAGLDRDPGWLPDFSRVVLFHFE